MMEGTKWLMLTVLDQRAFVHDTSSGFQLRDTHVIDQHTDKHTLFSRNSFVKIMTCSNLSRTLFQPDLKNI